MYSHDDIWRSIDRLAQTFGYSPSGLAKKAGLDPTTFNKSKRTSNDGKPRWPSTESIAKILSVTGLTMTDFFGMADAPAVQDPLQPGDRIAVKTRKKDVLEGTLVKKSGEGLEMRLTGGDKGFVSLRSTDIIWIARIVEQ